MSTKMRIGELAGRTGFGTKTIRYYEKIGLLSEPVRSESGYRLYSDEDRQRLELIAKAKQLGFSLEDIRDVLILHEQQQTPCVHVLALLEQKLSQVDGALKELRQFRRELAHLRQEASERLEQAPAGSAICGIIERGIHAKGEAALARLEFRRTGRSAGRQKESRKLPQRA